MGDNALHVNRRTLIDRAEADGAEDSIPRCNIAVIETITLAVAFAAACRIEVIEAGTHIAQSAGIVTTAQVLNQPPRFTQRRTSKVSNACRDYIRQASTVRHVDVCQGRRAIHSDHRQKLVATCDLENDLLQLVLRIEAGTLAEKIIQPVKRRDPHRASQQEVHSPEHSLLFGTRALAQEVAHNLQLFDTEFLKLQRQLRDDTATSKDIRRVCYAIVKVGFTVDFLCIGDCLTVRLALLACLFISRQHGATAADGVRLLEEEHRLVAQPIHCGIRRVKDAAQSAAGYRRGIPAHLVIAAAAVKANVREHASLTQHAQLGDTVLVVSALRYHRSKGTNTTQISRRVDKLCEVQQGTRHIEA